MIESKYPFIINDLMIYIEKIKKNDRSSALLDIIADYSIKKGIDPELVGDAIANDVYLKSFIEKDCKFHGIIRSDVSEISEW